MIQTIKKYNFQDDFINDKPSSVRSRKKTGGGSSSSYAIKTGDLERQNKNRTQSQQRQMGKVLEGVVVNNFIKDSPKEIDIDNLNIDDICNTLVIPDTFTKNPVLEEDGKANTKENNEEETSMIKRALPLAAVTVGIAGGALALAALFKKSASSLNSSKYTRGEKLPLLGMNMNIKEEHEFAAYMALRNPNKKTILAMIGVFFASGITLVGKNFIDAIKDIWVKKREADANKYLQESLIDIETRAFAGKLDVVREELVNKANYFKNALDSIEDSPEETKKPDIKADKDNPFMNFFGYKSLTFGNNPSSDAKENNPVKKDKKDSALPLVLFGAGVILAGILMGRKTFKNFQSADSELRKYVQKETKNIDKKISALAKKIESESSSSSAAGDLAELKHLLQIKRADSIEVENIYGRFKFLNKKDVQNAKMEIMTGIKSIYGDAPETMGGKVGQIQYYCYLDETRGHLYNWIMNPDNPFAGYLFMTFAAVNALGYSIKTAVEGMQEASINFENKKTEKNLQERLVDTEIRNFKSKKLSAIEPMMRDFDLKLKSGASKEELKTVAENILLEIKNGPPFVYA